MFGSHLSIAGSLINALDEAERLKLDTVQIFTKNQQQWKSSPLDPGIVRDWKARVAGLGWNEGGGRTVSHASYLINLASPDDALWRKSIDLMTDEIDRCEALGIPFLVHHPGAFTTSTREQGLVRIALAYAELFKRTRGYTTVSCLENTVGGGSTLGRDFAELALLRSMILETANGASNTEQRVGFCFDTCHAHAGGYDLSTPASAAAALAEFHRTCGLSTIRVLHLNDSKGAHASRLDRHEHIGKGTIGLKGFGAVLAEPAFAQVPKILETPKDKPEGGTPHDTLNLRKLRKLFPVTPIKTVAAARPMPPSKGREPATRPARTRKPRTEGC